MEPNSLELEMESLELGAWIEHVEKLGLIMTIDQLANAIKENVDVIPLERTLFEMRTSSKGYKRRYTSLFTAPGYPPKDFFYLGEKRWTLVRKSDLETRTTFCYNGVINRIEEREVPVVHCRVDEVFTGNRYVLGIHTTRADRHAETGAGGLHTRFMLWSVLQELNESLPWVYVSSSAQDEEDDDYDEDDDEDDY